MRHASAASAACLLCVFILGGAAGADAQVPIGDEFPLRPGLAPASVVPRAVAMGPSGDFVVVSRTGPGFGVIARRHDALGKPQGTEFVVATDGQVLQRGIAANGTAGFVVVWEGDVAGRRTVLARRLDPQGAPVGPLLVPPSGAGAMDSQPTVAGDPNGGFVVAWTNAPTLGPAKALYARRYDASGTPVGAEFQVSGGTETKVTPSVAMANDGTFVVAWGNYHYATPSRVMARRFDAAGAPSTPEIAVNPSNTYFHSGASTVTSDAAGNFLVVWGPNRLVSRKYRADGTPVTGEVDLDAWPAEGGVHAASDAAGNTLVTWIDSRGSLGRDILGRRVHPSGAPGPAFRVSSHDRFYSVGGELGMNADGRAIVVWYSSSDFNRPGEPMGRRYGPIGPIGLDVDFAPGTTANGNRVLEPGEVAIVAPRWRIVGTSAQALDGQAGVSGPAGGTYVAIDGVARYPVITEGGSGDCRDTADCYEVLADAASRPALHWDAALREDVMGLQPESMEWALHLGDSFADVTRAHPFYRFVETTLHRGVTAGCGGGLYCPDSPTTRAQAAVFLLLSRESAEFRPYFPCRGGFSDVPIGNPFCDWIEHLASEGVVAGCGGGRFCPDAAVTREQMSVLALRTLDVAASPPAPCTTPLFADVPASSPFCPWVEELARRGVVAGCGAGNYCPHFPVTRGQMAVMLTQVFGLRLYGP